MPQCPACTHPYVLVADRCAVLVEADTICGCTCGTRPEPEGLSGVVAGLFGRLREPVRTTARG